MRTFALAAVVTALAAGCGDDGSSPGDASAPPTTTTTTTGPGTPTGAVADRPQLDGLGLGLSPVAEAPEPVALVARPGSGVLWVAGRGGEVGVVAGGGAFRRLLDLRGLVGTGGEQGLLGIAFSRDGARLYLSYTDRDGDSRLEEVAVADDDSSLDGARRRLLLAVDQPADNHNGGNVLLGPDGLLWYGLGDGGGAGDRFGNAQDLDTLLGDILRIDPSPAAGLPYSIPADNPYAGGGGRPEIAVSGVRNPWRFSFDRGTGDLWIGDVGQNAREELDRLPAGRILGANLGWPRLEGSRPYDGNPPPPGAVAPVFDYGRADGQSVVGGFVYRGVAIPRLRGAYVFTDTYVSRLRALVPVGDGRYEQRDLGLEVPGGLVSSFGEDAEGELYVLSLAGRVHRLVAT